MKRSDLIDGSSLTGRTSPSTHTLRFAIVVVAALNAVLLTAISSFESVARVAVDKSALGERISFADTIDVGNAELPGRDGAVLDLDTISAAGPFRPAELDTVLSVVREHRRSADELWCVTLAEAIYDESIASEVDPLLITSIVAVESSFQSRIVSRMGAVGLMQLRPFVAEDVALRQNIEWTGPETLHTPHLNLRVGISYYKQLLDRFDGDATMALTAYNQGPTRVSRWVQSGSYAGSEYAARILRGYEALRSGRAWPAPTDRHSQS